MVRGTMTFEVVVPNKAELTKLANKLAAELDERYETGPHSSSLNEAPWTVIAALDECPWVAVIDAVSADAAATKALAREPDLTIIAKLAGENPRLVQAVEEEGAS